jgi:hypothetical protein
MSSKLDDSDDSSSEDDVDRTSDGKKSIVSKRKHPKNTKKIPDNDRQIKKRKGNKEKSENLDFNAKPANSIVSTKSDVKVDRRLVLLEKKVRWQHLVKMN